MLNSVLTKQNTTTFNELRILNTTLLSLEKKVAALEKLQKDNSIYQRFFNESKDLVCIANLSGYFTKINPAFSLLLGYSEEELLSRPFNDFVHPDDVQKTTDEVTLMNREGKSSIKFENRYITKNQEIVYLEWNTTVDEKNQTIFAIARDVTEKKKIEEQLIRSEKLLNESQNISKTGSWSYDFNSNDFYWSNEMYNLFQLDTSLKGKDLIDAFYLQIPSEEIEKLNSIYQKAFKGGTPFSTEHYLTFSEGTSKWIRATVIPIKDANDKVIKMEGIAQDITKNKLANEKMIRNDAMLETAQKMAKIGSWNLNLITNELYWSDELYSIFGLPNQPNPNLYFDYLSRFPEGDCEKLQSLISNAVITGEPYNFEHQIYLPDGSEKWIYCSGTPIKDQNGVVVKLEGFAQDITDKKKFEIIILNNIKEKEILIKELHHRVKNNMQVISSMLNLQSNIINEPTIKSVFKDSQLRIKSMAAVHDLLYRSNSLSEIDFSEYIKNLLADLVNSYKDVEKKVALNIDIPPVSFNLEKAIPLGLLVNEIVTNSLKHGFPNGHNGEITFKLSTMPNERYYIEISDNGIGMSECTNTSNDTLGLMLIDSLAEQLDGVHNRTSTSNGTNYSMIF